MSKYLRIVMRAMCIVLLFGATANAATYYIDYEGGNDSNNGAAKNSPWKRHPYMAGFSGKYSHVPGDRFIFKGGVTWPQSCFQLRIRTGGSSENNHDYYGVDQSWHTGNAWKRPLFDFQHKIIGSGWTTSAGINVDNVSCVTIDGLEIANLRCSPGAPAFGAMSILLLGKVNHVTVTNCVIRDWDFQPPLPANGFDSNGTGGVAWLDAQPGYGNGLKISHCTIHQAGVTTKSGTGTWNIGLVEFCEVHDTTQAVLGGGVIRNNHFYNFPDPTDPLAHNNAIETFVPSVIYNNVIHDLSSYTAPILMAADWGGASGINLVYNNVLFNVGNQVPIGLDTSGKNPSKIGLRAYNNTVEHYNAACVGVALRSPSYTFGLLDVRNNHFITTGNPVGYNDVAKSWGNVASVTIVNNLVQSQAEATARGYTRDNFYAPTSPKSPTVGIGLDLSGTFTTDIAGKARPAGGWDIGAYQMSGKGPDVPNPGRVNSPPNIAPIQSSVPDSSGNSGYQVLAGSPVRLFTTISDPDGNALNWSWSYSVDGGQSVSHSSGEGGNSESTFTYGAVAAGKKYTWTLSARDGTTSTQATFQIEVVAAPAQPTKLPLILTATTPDQLKGPFVTDNGYLVQGSETALNAGGRATFTFSVPTAGQFTVAGLVDAPSESANSFYISVDSEPQDPEATWHVPVTQGAEWRTVSWQGNGTWNKPAFVPKYFQLSAGQHTLIVVGREAGARIAQLKISKVPSPPKNLRLATGF